jgi:two-component system sensor histidine kinase PhoQ
MSSLSLRLLISVSLLLLFFFGATIIVLDTAFREAGEQAREDILDGQLMMLLAAAEPNIYGELEVPVDLRESRFSSLDSGLYGELRDDSDDPVWRSRSSLGLNISYGTPPVLGTHQFSRVTMDDGTPLMALTLAVEWELASGVLKPYTFSVAESMDSFNAQLREFRGQLFGWFAAIALIMLLIISIVMRGLLKPLRMIEEEIGDIEAGRREELSGGYPTELTGVARNMNLLVGSERARSERYRKTLDNLAHSLKTPLAAIRSVLDENDASDDTQRIESQIDRMNDIVRYQLRKPATYASETFGIKAVPVEDDLHRLVDGLTKVYRDKKPVIELRVPPGTTFLGDSGDFLELAGNLLDNACKWCDSRVRLTIDVLDIDSPGAMRIAASDDGPGIPSDVAAKLLERGMRLDESAPGHGIGLAVVKDIAASYGGDVTIGTSDLGGAEIAVTVNPGGNS